MEASEIEALYHSLTPDVTKKLLDSKQPDTEAPRVKPTIEQEEQSFDSEKVYALLSNPR
jgi:hypothetical protein